MKVALIGANGFVGTRLTEMFHLGGRHEVVAIVRRPSSLALPARFDLETRLGDALDSVSLAEAIAGCDAVVHAAIGDPAQIEAMPGELCRAAAAAKINRIVYLSSASVHGQNPAPGTDESTPLVPRHAIDYNNAKIRAEQRFFTECKRLHLQGYALRPGVVFGPRSRWIADLATELSEGSAWLFNEGRGICNSIYVDNLVEAVALCLQANHGADAPYLVGDNETVTWADFYRQAAEHLDVPCTSIHQLDRLPGFQRTMRDHANRAAALPWVQRMLPLVPNGLKRGTKAVLAAWTPAPRQDSWSLPRGPRPQITQEMALLQQCTWKFPHARAAKTLGYEPPVTFAAGMDRSFAWWRFAQGHLSTAA